MLTQIITFVDERQGTPNKGADPVYVPQVAHFTGDLDAHDLAFDKAGQFVFVNTLFSCLAGVSESSLTAGRLVKACDADKPDPLGCMTRRH